MHEVLSWEALEYEHREKSSDWYWALGIVAVSSAIAAIIFENVLFAILILVGAFTLALYAARPPRIVRIELTDRGIVIDRRLYAYSALTSFWIIERGEDRDDALLVKTKGIMPPDIVVPLTGISGNEVRSHLIQYLPEVEDHESLFEHFLRLLGF